MRKHKFPNWRSLSLRAKAWALFILLGPFGAAFLIKTLEKTGSTRILSVIEELVSWGILTLFVFLCYLLLSWLSDRGGESRFYR